MRRNEEKELEFLVSSEVGQRLFYVHVASLG